MIVKELNSHIDSIVKDINQLYDDSKLILISMIWGDNVPLIVYDEFFEKIEFDVEKFNKFKILKWL